MNWFDQWLYKKTKYLWDNSHQFENGINKMGTALVGAQTAIDRGYSEGQDRINFELTAAVGGRILNVRRYDDRKDRNETQTYVIPSGEDVGARVAKILNLELLK